jgi:hypothetical protein
MLSLLLHAQFAFSWSPRICIRPTHIPLREPYACKVLKWSVPVAIITLAWRDMCGSWRFAENLLFIICQACMLTFKLLIPAHMQASLATHPSNQGRSAPPQYFYRVHVKPTTLEYLTYRGKGKPSCLLLKRSTGTDLAAISVFALLDLLQSRSIHAYSYLSAGSSPVTSKSPHHIYNYDKH